MYTSKWEVAKSVKNCSGCDVHMLPGSKYLITKFTMDDESNLSKLVTIYLCERCIETFMDIVDDNPQSPSNDDNPEPPKRA
jgi:hypothetical protein